MKHVRQTKHLLRYRFPTHINDLVYDRSEARCSEAFMVVLDPGGAPPRHKHDDTEQVFYIIEGDGLLTAGDEAPQPVRPGDVVVLPPGAWHSIRAGKAGMRYLAVDCFVSEKAREEPTWDEHARVLCKRNGWDYTKVVEGKT